MKGESDSRPHASFADNTVIDFSTVARQDDLWDAGEALTTLFDRADELDLPPGLLGVLVTLDEAISSALVRGGVADGRNGSIAKPLRR